MQPILELVKVQGWILFIKVLKGGIRKKNPKMGPSKGKWTNLSVSSW
jgi:hypothetical protein